MPLYTPADVIIPFPEQSVIKRPKTPFRGQARAVSTFRKQILTAVIGLILLNIVISSFFAMFYYSNSTLPLPLVQQPNSIPNPGYYLNSSSKSLQNSIRLVEQ